jgi:hypothetical protein
MRWPWSRKQPKAEPVVDDIEEATRARRHAERALEQAKGRTGEVRQAAADLRRNGRVNHFAELISDTFWGHR